MASLNKISLIQPDDWHCHLRDDVYLARTVADTAKQFKRAIVMPNLKPPITTIDQARDYRERILIAAKNTNFQPLMTLYLTENMSPDILSEAKKSSLITACKYYPAGATTNAENGINSIKKIFPLLEAMQSTDLPLCIHGESIASNVDIFEREKIFLTESLTIIINHFPKLRVILEHISTRTAVEFILSSPKNIAATITPHHLHYNRNDLFYRGIHPHLFCMPILKRVDDQSALIQAAISGNPKFFLGTDSAPHTIETKETACGCAGIYSSHAALAFYAEIFEKNNALTKLENFTSIFGAEFYQLPTNKDKITLVKKPYKIAEKLTFGTSHLIPMKAGEMVSWQIQ